MKLPRPWNLVNLATRILCVLVGIILADIFAYHTALGQTDDKFTPDLVCGPRCVRYLLKHYNGEAPELITLVRQIQWPKMSDGSSFADLQKSLESYGITTKPVQIPGLRLPITPHPCICHFRPQNSPVGHFVVLLPGTTRTTCLIWDNGVITECPSWELIEQSSGVYLMTAPHGATPDWVAVMTTDSLAARVGYYALFLFASLGAANLVVRMRLRWIKRKQKDSSETVNQGGSRLHLPRL
jgi:hypothetical protein